MILKYLLYLPFAIGLIYISVELSKQWFEILVHLEHYNYLTIKDYVTMGLKTIIIIAFSIITNYLYFVGLGLAN